MTKKNPSIYGFEFYEKIKQRVSSIRGSTFLLIQMKTTIPVSGHGV